MKSTKCLAWLVAIFLFITFFFVTLPHAAAERQKRYALSQAHIQSVSGGTCGFIRNKWRAIRRARSFSNRYVVDRKASKRVRRTCRRLTNPAEVSSLAQLPNTSDLTRSSEAAQLRAAAISGTPPVLPALPSLNIKNVFWRAGVVNAIATGTPTETQCGEFFGAAADGQSAGLSACYLTQNTGYALQNILSGGTSLCYMKNVPTQANLNAGAIDLIRGRLPNNDVAQIFSQPPGRSNRLVKVQATSEMGRENIFLRIYSAENNSNNGDQFRADLWFCRGNGPTATGFQILRVTTAGAFIASDTNAGGGEEGAFDSLVTAYLTRENGEFVFDTRRSRSATVTYIRGDDINSKSDLVITADDKIYNKTYDVFPDQTRLSYSIASFSGTDISDLRFLEGAYKDRFTQNEDTFTSSAASEYRSTYYASAPASSILDELDAVSFSSDPFYRSAGEIDTNFSRYRCDATADIVVSMDLSHPALESVSQECEGNRLEEMDFCNSNDAVNTAYQRYFDVCGNP